MKITKLKCAKRSVELKNGVYKLNDHAYVAKVSQLGSHSIFKYIGEDPIDDPDSKESWYELLDWESNDGWCKMKVHELDEYGKPLTLAKIKKKYGVDSYRVKRFIELTAKYGCTYILDYCNEDYVLEANVGCSYDDNYEQLYPVSDESKTKYFTKFDENGYRILKDKPENYDPEFDNSPTYDKFYEGEDIQYAGDWKVRNNYFQGSTEYNKRKEVAIDTSSSYLKLPRLYNCFSQDTWGTLRKYLISFGMTEDQFDQLKSMIKPSSTYFYVTSKEAKEFCKPFKGTWDYVKKFVNDFSNQYLEAYLNS